MTIHGKTWLQRALGRTDIPDDLTGEVYMERWRLRPIKGWKHPRVHHILRSDLDRHFHDHPFDFTSLILSGGYWEFRPVDPQTLALFRSVIAAAGGQTENRVPVTKCWYGPGSIVRRKAEDLHRLELKPGQTTWTLVLAGPVRRDWGFQTENGWVHNKKYRELLQAKGARL